MTPNPNDPVTAAPGTVGPPNVTPGDPHGVEVTGTATAWIPPTIVPSPWSGWPAEWWPPPWNGSTPEQLSSTVFACLDINSSALCDMPPYLVNAPPSLDTEWLRNPDPDLYTSWNEFARTLFWDFQLGEAFVIATAWYSTGWPARFHVVPPWSVNVELDEGRRIYRIGDLDVTNRMLHIRYKSSIGAAHGYGALDVATPLLLASRVLTRYASQAGDMIPSSLLKSPEAMPPAQAQALRDQWIQQRLAMPGMPAVLSGGLDWIPTQLDPEQMGLVKLQQDLESKIAVLFRVPPYMLGLPMGDSLTYSNATAQFDYHWRSNLKWMASMVMSALSQWALPRATQVELNRDEYVQPGPYERAQTYQILNGIRDPVTGKAAMEIDEIREAERLVNTTPTDLAAGVLK